MKNKKTMKTISLKLAKEIHNLAKEKGVRLAESESTEGGYYNHSGQMSVEYQKYTTDELLEMLIKFRINMYRTPYSKYHFSAIHFPTNKTDSLNFGNKEASSNADTPAEALGLLFKKLLAKDLIK